MPTSSPTCSHEADRRTPVICLHALHQCALRTYLEISQQYLGISLRQRQAAGAA